MATVAATMMATGASEARAEDESEGKRRFQRGSELYNQGKFLDAAREFELGFKAAPRPLFLLNIGHSYRRGGEFPKAKAAYEQLLRMDPGTTYRVEVEGLIRTIDDALQSAETTASRPPARTEAPAPRPAPAPSVAAASTTSGSAGRDTPVYVTRPASSEDEARDESVFRKTWFWVVVGGAAAAVGATVAVFALRKDGGCPGTLCLKEPTP